MTTLLDFTRVAWTSAHAKAVWGPRVAAISAALLDVEVASVRAGLRPAALQFTPTTAALRRFDGLAFAPVAPGRCVVGQDRATVDAFLTAWHARDDRAVGLLLGFPSCCVDFFDRVWNRDGLRDTTLDMAGAAGPDACNILGRWIGVRAVPHLPCAWDCPATAAFAARLNALWPDDVRGWRDTILSWPALYSALHGVAIVTFPVCKIVTNTDYTAGEHVVKHAGTSYPDEAPSGLTFPFRTHTRPAPLRLLKAADPRDWTDNGFPTKAGMDADHAPILATLAGLPYKPSSVLDLGCGNGALLAKIGATTLVGVESNSDRAARAKPAVDVRGQTIVQFVRANPSALFDVALIARARLTEVGVEESRLISDWLERHARYVVLYGYNDATPPVLRETEFRKMEKATCLA